MPPKKPQIKRSGPLDSVDPRAALDEFARLLEVANQLAWKRNFPELDAWESEVKIALSRFYGGDSEEYARFDAIWFRPGMYYSGQPDKDFIDAFQHGIQQARMFLTSRKRDWEARTSASTPTRRAIVANPKDVFVVHGHDHGIKETVARFLSKVGLSPIILHEQPDEGRTIIEKFEHHAYVSFAIVIFSKDDLGVAVNGLPKDKPIESALRPRARQNVVLELGYFMGALGRKNVRAIVEDGVETPSDFSGVLYIPFDAADGWRLKLVKELKSAGLQVDANAAFD